MYLRKRADGRPSRMYHKGLFPSFSQHADHPATMNIHAKRPTAFLDASVVAEILRGKQPSVALLEDEVRARVDLAINPIVLQEIFALPEVQGKPSLIDRLQASLTILPVDLPRAADLLERHSELRKLLSHSNEVLVLGSAIDCDFFVTYDRKYVRVPIPNSVKVVTPDELLAELGVR